MKKMKDKTETYLTLEHFDTYIELVFSIMCVRHPKLHKSILDIVPGVTVSSSYIIDGDKQNLCIPADGIINGFREEGLTDVESLKRGFLHVNSMFLVSMWANLTSTECYEYICKEQDVQFFRHIRNGCSHGNRLNFNNLNHSAKWRDKTISESDTGKAVFPDVLKEGDPFLLLLDINNKYFKNLSIQGMKEFCGE